MIGMLLVAPMVIFVALLVVGGLTGRATVRSCCAVPAERDLRLHPTPTDEVAQFPHD
jgi:hypothetical protein